MRTMSSPRRGTPPDLDLIRRLQARDPAAFDEVVSTYRDPVFRFILRSVRDRQTAEDLTQDAFVKLYRHAPTLEHGERFLPWLYRTARTTLIDHQRRLKRERRIFAEDGPLARSARLYEQPVPTLERAERAEQLRAAIAELPERFRTPFLLRETEGLRYQEISKILGVPEKTVSSRISRARRMLAARLARALDVRPGRADDSTAGREDGMHGEESV